MFAMKGLKKEQTAKALKAVLVLLVTLIGTIRASAATINWTGGTSSDWGTASNWSTATTLPGSGDIVQIGVVAFTNQPTLNSGTTTTIASLTFGLYKNIVLTVNSGYTLAVTGAITQNQANLATYGSFTSTIAGAGTVTGASMVVGSSTLLPPVLANNYLQVTSTISKLHITGNVTVNSTDFGVLIVGVGYNNVKFSLQGGTTIIDGAILTANASNGVLPLSVAYPVFSIDIPSGSALTPVLQLTSANAINTSSVTNSINFYNNTGGTGASTVYYSGTSQEVYTNTTACLSSSPETYQYLQLTGSGTATPDGGILSVAADLTSTAPYVAFNTNNPAVNIGGNWNNTSASTQGSGNITVAGSITNNSGGALNLGSGNLYVATNYTNNVGGIYAQTTGTTYFNGSGTQALTDNSTTGTTFKLVDFSGGGTSTMSAGSNNINFAVASTGVLTMSNSSKLVAGSSSAAYLTLKSDTNGTATVAAIPTGCSISGFVTAQRFVQGSATFDSFTDRWIARDYRLMTSPVNEGKDGSNNYPYSLNYLGAGTIITDCTSSYATKGGNPSLYLFDENITPYNASFTGGNFIGITNISNTLASGTISTTISTYSTAKVYVGDGYMMYFRGDNVTHLTGTPNKTTYPFVAPESVTFSTSGNLNQGTYSVVSWIGSAGLMYSTSNSGNSTVRGYNLVGNPYPSSIDWSTFSNTNSSAAIYGKNVNPTIYFFNPTTGNYNTYNATTHISTGAASKIITSGQGFFVQANAASPTLTFNESAKTATEVTGSNLLMGTPVSQTAYNSYLRLQVVTDAINNDDMVIGFNQASSGKYNPAEDSQILPGSGAAQYISATSSDGIKASVKWLPFPNAATTQVIKLNVNVAATGQYTLQRIDLEAIPALYEIWLMDYYKKDSLDIRGNTSYVFDVDLTDTTSYGSNRFAVVVRQNPALGVHLLSFSASKVKGASQVTWTTENEANYTNFTVERSIDGGTTFAVLGGVASASQGTYSFMDNNPITGADIYRLQVRDLNGVISYSNVVTLMYGNAAASQTANNISVYPNPSNGVINLAINQQATTVTAGISTLQSESISPILNNSSSVAATNNSYNIRIISMTGSIVKTASSSSVSWQDNVSNLAPGTYVIQVMNNKNATLVGRSTFIKM
jgi:hypothetical protein